jgi:hypothetical protein
MVLLDNDDPAQGNDRPRACSRLLQNPAKELDDAEE